MPATNTHTPPVISTAWPEALAQRPLIMGIVNVTPDSFSDGGQFAAHASAIAHGHAMMLEGADILDIGGESTRPGAPFVDADEEIARIIPVITGLSSHAPISVDTYKAKTAEAAIKAGASIVNDVWGLQRDAAMADIVAEAGVGLVIMHNRTEKDPALDIVADIERFFEISLGLAQRAGIAPEAIMLDPGVGFGKTPEQNLAAIVSIARLKRLGHRILLGVSRKSFIGLITDRPVDQRGAGTLAVDCYGLLAGADIVRVHDVAPHRDALRVLLALKAAESSSPVFKS